MTRYLLSLYQPDRDPPVDGDLEEIQRELDTLENDAKTAGAWLFSGGLRPLRQTTVVRAKGDDVLVTDGPYVEGKEHLGGIMVVEAPDLAAAKGWGERLSRAATLPVEIRPFE